MADGIINRYPTLLPLNSSTPKLSLGEGSTPLIRSNTIEKQLNIGELYFKYEGSNPTGSFKDRGMVIAVAKALEQTSKAIICASTGNTSASAAAYGASSGLETIVIIPKGNVASGKVAQAVVYGAKIIAIDGSFDKALEIVREISKNPEITLVNSINPNRIEGQKTAAFEIVDSLNEAPDDVFIPVGNAGNITAYWKGFTEYQDTGLASKTPRMFGFQAEGAAPIVIGKKVDNPQTIATAIRIGNPASWEGAIKARDESNGDISSVSDEEILDAYRKLGGLEGVFAEPASAASLAGLIKYASNKDLSDHKVVCIITGSGLKDPEIAVAGVEKNIQEVSASISEVSGLLGL
ncbi:MAG: threonine synthase [Dehalococcoidia bacterium]